MKQNGIEVDNEYETNKKMKLNKVTNEFRKLKR